MPNTLSKTAIGSRIQEVNQLESEDLCLWLVADNGYRDARVLADGSVAALIDLLYTLVAVGMAGATGIALRILRWLTNDLLSCGAKMMYPRGT